MNFGIFIFVIANLANGYLLNSIPLEKLMQKAMTAGKRSEVKIRFPSDYNHGFQEMMKRGLDHSSATYQIPMWI